VGVDGSVDWCCLPRFDSPSIFGRLLDAERGGAWELAPVTEFASWQRYSEETNILQTVFESESGRAEVTDFMPVDAATIRDHARPHDRCRLIRVVTGLAGKVRFRQRVDLRPDYGSLDNPLKPDAGRLHGEASGHHVCVTGTTPLVGPQQEFEVKPGQSVAFGLTVNQPHRCGQGAGTLTQVRARLRETQQFWWGWSARCNYSGPYRNHVLRSALALKLMTYSPTGALVAAATTSLPESIGGPRNWDYRFTWLRDASFSLYTLFQLGYESEAHDFMQWLTHLTLEKKVRNFYTLDGDESPPERELQHLSGYRGSRPVRIGNAAADQLQLDVYGEVLDCAYIYSRRGGLVSDELWTELCHLTDLAAERWPDPDASIWEVRGRNQGFTYSKVMCWVALDRACKIGQRSGLSPPPARWHEARSAVHRSITRRGWSDRLKAFTQVFDGDSLDAAALRLPQVGFLGPDDPRLRQTVDAIARDLSLGPMVRRYDVTATDDGLKGTEGAFVMCAFWLVDALAHAGELEEAELRFQSVLSLSSPLGLFSEEIDPQSGELLGNFPQAFSHLALVAAAVNIERQRHHVLGQRARG
jgi:GH15 family glucan-1,4-alpha-glucosidase